MDARTAAAAENVLSICGRADGDINTTLYDIDVDIETILKRYWKIDWVYHEVDWVYHEVECFYHQMDFFKTSRQKLIVSTLKVSVSILKLIVPQKALA